MIIRNARAEDEWFDGHWDGNLTMRGDDLGGGLGGGGGQRAGLDWPTQVRPKCPRADSLEINGIARVC